MNYRALLVLSCLTTVGFAAAPKKEVSLEPKPGDYDYDLFRKDKKVVFVNAELLYWTVNEGGLDYALKMKQPAWGPLTDANGHFERAEFGWRPGFRGNIGYYSGPSVWDIQLQYTYYKGKGHDRAKAPKESDLFLNGTWPEPNPFGAASLETAHSNIKLHLDLLEFLATRRFVPNAHLRMRVYGGVNAVWLRQNWSIHYRDTDGVKSHLRNHWKFTGAGIRLGYIVDWFMHIQGLYLTGAISAAGFAGSYHNVSRQTSNFSMTGFNPALPSRNTHYHDNRLISHVQVLAGPSWQQAFTNCRTEIFVGYEFNLWSNLHEVFRSIVGLPTGPKQTFINDSAVGIQGATLRFNLDF